MRNARLIPLCAALALLACKPKPEGPCAASIGGDWVTASDSRFGYHLEDRGDEITGEAYQRSPSGKRQPGPPGEAPITLALHRRGREIAGTMRSTTATPKGKACAVDFAVRVSSCAPGKLQVVGEMSAPIDESCQRLTAQADGGGIPPDLAEFVWVRPSTD
jgi:hypothetical protein